MADETLPPGFQLDDSQAVAAQPPSDGSSVPAGFQLDEDKYGGFGQQALNVAEHVGKGIAGPISTGIEAGLSKLGVPGLTPEDQAGREAAGPIKAGLAEVGGFAGPAILSGGLSAAARAGMEIPEAISMGAKALAESGLAGQLEKAGKTAEAIAPALGIGGKSAGALGKIGSAAVRGAVENGLYMAQDETSKLINGDPNQSLQTAIAHVGLAGILPGGVIGGGAGAISSLWKKTLGSKLGETLHAISDHMGGIEGVEANPIDSLISKTGMDIAPEVQAAASKDPMMREFASVLGQSDNSNAGRTFQKSKQEAMNKASEAITESLGRSSDQIPSELDKYSMGKGIGDTLADEVSERIAPLKSGYDEAAEKFSGKNLDPTADELSARAKAEAKAAKTIAKVKSSPAEIMGEKEPIDTRGVVTPSENIGIDKLEALQKDHYLGAETSKGQKNYSEEELDDLLMKKRQAAADKANALAEKEAITKFGPPEKYQGTVDSLQEKIGNLAIKEGWTVSPSSEIMKAVNNIQKELPNLKTLGNLTDYIKAVGNNTFDPMNKSLTRAGMQIKSILREAEGNLIAQHVGAQDGEKALLKYRLTQENYHIESQIREELESRLGKLGSTSSYHENIREMARTDGEGILRKLSGKNDADTIRLLQENFPKTAQAVRESILDQVLSKAKNGEELSPQRILKGLSDLSPQQRALVIPSESSERIGAISDFLEQLKDKTHNFSNSGRTAAKLMQGMPGAAVGMIAMLLGHNPAAGLALGALTKYVGKEAPDATRLALLKWMGSNKPIEAGAFKSMVDFIHATQKGDSLMTNATKSIFSGGSKVILKNLIPSESDTTNLDNKLKKLQHDPSSLQSASADSGYYMPNHSMAMTATASRAAQYLNSLRPTSARQSPLDPEVEPSQDQKYTFNRALQIAQQPLVVTHLIKEGQLTSDDVSHLSNLYPQFHQRLAQKLTDAMIEHTSKGQVVPYNLRVGVSALMGTPMDSSLSAQAIMSNQASFAQSERQGPSKTATTSKAKPSQVGMRDMKIANRSSLSLDKDET